MKTKIILYLILIFSIAIQAQVNVIDNLQNELKKAKSDIDKAKSYNAISDHYKNSDPNKMEEYGNKALQIAQKIDQKIEEGNAYINIGTSNIILGDYKKALDYFILAEAVFEENAISESNKKECIQGLAKTYGNMGIVFNNQGNYTNALRFYIKSVKLYEGLNDERQCSKLYNNIAITLQSHFLPSKEALEYFIKAQKIQEKLQDPNIGTTYTNIANIYFEEESLDNAFEYYTLAKSSLDKNPNPRALGEWYNHIGLYYKSKHQLDKAIENWQNAMMTFQSIDYKFGLASTYHLFGQLYLEQNQQNKALQMANKALNLADELNVLEQKEMSEKLLTDIYIKKGNTSLALEHFQKHNIAKDILWNEKNIQESVEASMTYKFEKKMLLQKEANDRRELLLKEEAKSSKMKLIFGSLIALLLTGMGFLIYNRMQLKKTLTLQKELVEYEQKALHLQMNPHFVFNCLGSISSFIVQNGTDSAIKYLSKFSKLMRLTLEYSKEPSIPIDKEIESLQNYLELEQLRFNHKFNFKINKSKNIEDDVVLPPLLLQPFVENAIIHGVIPKKEMGMINIGFSLVNEFLICTIIDNGIGIHKSKQNKENMVLAHKSMALDIIKKRLEMIGSSTSKKATIEIEELTEDNEITGTKVVLQLPLQYME